MYAKLTFNTGVTPNQVTDALAEVIGGATDLTAVANVDSANSTLDVTIPSPYVVNTTPDTSSSSSYYRCLNIETPMANGNYATLYLRNRNSSKPYFVPRFGDMPALGYSPDTALGGYMGETCSEVFGDASSLTGTMTAALVVYVGITASGEWVIHFPATNAMYHGGYTKNIFVDPSWNDLSNTDTFKNVFCLHPYAFYSQANVYHDGYPVAGNPDGSAKASLAMSGMAGTQNNYNYTYMSLTYDGVGTGSTIYVKDKYIFHLSDASEASHNANRVGLLISDSPDDTCWYTNCLNRFALGDTVAYNSKTYRVFLCEGMNYSDDTGTFAGGVILEC